MSTLQSVNLGSNPCRVIPKTLKLIFAPSVLDNLRKEMVLRKTLQVRLLCPLGKAINRIPHFYVAEVAPCRRLRLATASEAGGERIKFLTSFTFV